MTNDEWIFGGLVRRGEAAEVEGLVRE